MLGVATYRDRMQKFIRVRNASWSELSGMKSRFPRTGGRRVPPDRAAMKGAQQALVLAFTAMLVLLGHPGWAGEDPCGGTGGIGQVVRVDKNAFTIRRRDDSGNQVVHLAPRAVIRTSSGPASLTELLTGSSVTLVGNPEQDGSFTADTVVVCKEGQDVGQQVDGSAGLPARTAPPRASPEQVSPQQSTRQPPAAARYQDVSRIVDGTTVGLACLTWCGAVLFLRKRKKVGAVPVLFLAVFSVYIYKVLDYTLLQFQSLLLLRHLVPGLQLHGLPAGTSVNLVPLISLGRQDVTTSLLNILMLMPFGFGLPFVTGLRFTRVVVVAAAFSLAIESLQCATGLLSNTTFRVADINDVIFNTAGAAIGYAGFLGVGRVLRAALRDRRLGQNRILRYICERPQLDAAAFDVPEAALDLRAFVG